MMSPDTASGPEEPIACRLGDDDLDLQSQRWNTLRVESGRTRVAVDDGLELTFEDTPAVEGELRALVAIENECCAWASWEVSRENDILVMHARSNGDGVAALHGMFLE